jgi:multidrug efflux pump subunit AcrB
MGAFANLTIGLLFAAVFVYALMVVNYQSFIDPLAVILALPGAGGGILLLLFESYDGGAHVASRSTALPIV